MRKGSCWDAFVESVVSSCCFAVGELDPCQVYGV